MREELDKKLCETYPKMMVDRNKPMTETCMCWGFECGDGWYDLLNHLMSGIQHHIDWKQKQRSAAIAHNQAIIDAQRQPPNWTKFNEVYPTNNSWTEELRKSIINHTATLREVPNECPQVVLNQVKEKFGTLRFYYTGGDDYISGMVTLAESLSGTICEGCGSSAKTYWPKSENGGIGGWVRTLCQSCESKRNEQFN